MRFEVFSDLQYSVQSPSTIILGNQALRTRSQSIVQESLLIEPRLQHDEIVSPSGDTRFVRVITGAVKTLRVSYRATVDCAREHVDAGELKRVPVSELDHQTLAYLFPSRYCQSDQLNRLAWRQFGEIENSYDRVMAICDWIHDNVDYVSGSTNSGTSAYDTLIQRAGVCRDFAHLGVALCRALNMPARYFAGYAYQLQPADFHACFEVFVGNRWIIFDATRLAPLNGLVRIGTGRDAADTAVASLFGNVQLVEMHVGCDVLDKSFKPLRPTDLSDKGLCLEA